MRVLESSIERKVVAWCKKHCVLTTKLNGLGQRGKPDRVFWMPGGKAVLAEFKRPGGKLTRLQIHNAECFQELGFDFYTFDSAERAISVLHRQLYDRFESVGAGE